ncbi:solute carrier organic anion transporter family member 1B3-like [Ptychodera flava]|uniref:solute carrier organic anion transporter family member 1B3-like n=1 Tax=Ptychodera flava TaxID=63121 RepID=UPI003969E08B
METELTIDFVYPTLQHILIRFSKTTDESKNRNGTGMYGSSSRAQQPSAKQQRHGEVGEVAVTRQSFPAGPDGRAHVADSPTRQDDPDTMFGIRNWRPQCLQIFANFKVTFFILCVGGFLFSVNFSCFLSGLTSIQKRYSLNSTVMGLNTSMFDLGTLISVVVVSIFFSQPDSHRPRVTGLGIYNTAIALGPVVGFPISSLFINLYVDFDRVNMASININPNDTRWVGAWWLGFLVYSAITLVIGIHIILLPKRFSPSQERDPMITIPSVLTSNDDCDANVEQEAIRRIKGIVYVLSISLGTLTGGILMRYFKLSPLSTAKALVVYGVVTLLLPIPLLFLGCEQNSFAGISVPYSDMTKSLISVVEQEDKPLAVGIRQFFNQVIGLVPTPIYMGYIIDSACLFWGVSECSMFATCWIYDLFDYRLKMLIFQIALKISAIAMYLVFWQSLS